MWYNPPLSSLTCMEGIPCIEGLLMCAKMMSSSYFSPHPTPLFLRVGMIIIAVISHQHTKVPRTFGPGVCLIQGRIVVNSYCTIAIMVTRLYT
jgi:hypothetical protein